MRHGNAERKRTDLSAERRIELNRPADIRRHGVLILDQRKSAVPVGRQVNRIVRQYRSAIVANHHRNVGGLRGNTVDRNARGRVPTVLSNAGM